MKILFSGLLLAASFSTNAQQSAPFQLIRKDGYYKYDNGATKVVPLSKDEMKSLDGVLKMLEPTGPGADSMARKMPGGVIPGSGSPEIRYLFFTSDSTGVIANASQRDSATETRILTGFEKARRGESQAGSKLTSVHTWGGKHIAFDVSTEGKVMTQCVGFIFPDALVILEVIPVFNYSTEAFANKKVYRFYPFPTKQ